MSQPEVDCPEADSFDHHSSEYTRRWPDVYRRLRAERPIFRSPKHGGYWVLSRYADISAVGRASDLFASGRWRDDEGAMQGGISIPANPFRIIPDESDQPEWSDYRAVLNATLGPKAIEQRRARAQQLAASLIDQVIESGRIDLVWDLSNPLPALVTMEFMGLPIDEWRAFSDPFHSITAPYGSDIWKKAATELADITEELTALALERRKNPGDDFISAVAVARRDGEFFSEADIADVLLQTLGGGVDTTTALTSNVFMYLHRHPEARRRLIDEPGIRAKAREEFVRYYTPVMTTARTATRDTEIAGQPISRGDRVLASYCSANRDPDIFADPERVILDRSPNPHIGFGAGMHRCVGSNLARMMFDAMLGEVLARLPDYVVDEEAAERYVSTPIVNGWMTMPARFTPGPKSEHAGILREAARKPE